MVTTTTQAIAPAHVLRGDLFWPEAIEAIAQLGRRPLLLGRSPSTATIRQALSGALEQPMNQAIAFARQQPVVYVVDEVLRAAVETGAPTGMRMAAIPMASAAGSG
jgi:hypothetical protein